MISGDFLDAAERSLRRALALDADYAEARVQMRRSNSLFMRNGLLESFLTSSSAGLGIRVLLKSSMGFSSTNDPKEADRAVENAIRGARAALDVTKPIRMSQEEFTEASFSSKVLKKPEDVPLEEKVEYMEEIDDAAKGRTITARLITLSHSRELTHVINSEGGRVSGDVTRAGVSSMLTLVLGDRSTQDSVGRGGTGGWEQKEEWMLVDEVARISDAMKMRLEKGLPAPRGKKDVVLGPHVVGLMMHESTGHPYEADRITGREAAQAGESFVRPGMLGTRIGSELVTVVDDPTLEGSSGFYLYDMEGVRARKRVLVEDGIISEFLHNRETAAEFGVSSNAASRASAFDREPIIRMANTFMLPGDQSKEELIEGVKDGVFIARYMEWNIDDRRYNQRYVGSEAYTIRDGRLGEMVLRPIIEITTPGFYSNIEAVGKDLQFEPGTCGKSDPGQGVPVWFGGPSVRLRGIRLGGI